MTIDDDGRGTALDGRAAAYSAVVAALSGRGFVRRRLDALRLAGRLDRREAAFALEIGHGAVRHAVTIAHLLSATARFDERRTDVRLRAMLFTAAYQMVWMDRVPLFAAVDEAVRLARRRLNRRAVGMVNAVLRRLSDAIGERDVAWQPGDPARVRTSWDRACAFSQAVLPDPATDSILHMAAATGERAARYRQLVERFGAERAGAVGWASQAVPPIVLQRNALRIDEAAFTQRMLAELGDTAVLHEGAAFLEPGTRIVNAPLFRDGLAYIQDSTARRAAEMVAAKPGERVLDLCAAPGGKMIAIAQQMQDRGELVACDVSDERLERLRANIGRLKLCCVRAVLLSEGAKTEPVGEFDAAIVDVPCSNSGVLARRPEARLRLSRTKMVNLAQEQLRLLASAAERIRPGGRLVYSTCSIDREENEGVVNAFIGQHAGWQVEDQWLELPTWGPGPFNWRDGGFAATLAMNE